MVFYILFSHTVFKLWCVFDTYSENENSHVGPVAPLLNGTALAALQSRDFSIPSLQ